MSKTNYNKTYICLPYKSMTKSKYDLCSLDFEEKQRQTKK